MSTRHVRKWMIAAPIIGFLAMGCGSSNTTFTGVGGSGNGGTSTGGTGDRGGNGGSSAGTDSGGSGGSSAGNGGSGGTAGTAGTGGSGSTGGTGGSGGTDPEIDYEPVGIGDPWFFSSESDMLLFGFAAGGGNPNDTSDDAVEAHSWSNGEIHIAATFDAAGDEVQMHFTTPYDGTVNTANLAGRVLKARVRVAAGATAAGGVQFFTQSGGWGAQGSWVTAGWTNIEDLGSYTDITFPMTSALQANHVQRFGLQLFGTGAGTVELIIDDLRIEPAETPPGPDGGVNEVDAGGGYEPPVVDAGGGYEPEPDAGGGGTGGTGGTDSGGTDSGGTGGTDSGGTGGTDSGGTGGSGGLGYEPVGVGDPWFFDTEAEMNAFSFLDSANATQTHTWSDGEVHVTTNIAANGGTVKMQIDLPANTDMTGRVLKARMKVSGTGNGHMEAFVQSGDGWTWKTAPNVPTSSLGSYADVTFPMTLATDATNVRRIGLQFYAYSGSGTVAELIVDDVRIEPETP